MRRIRHFALAGFVIALSALAADNAAPSAKNPPAGKSADEHLVGWWTFDEADGKTIQDSSSKKRNGTLEGSLALPAASVEGRIGKAIQFDGKDQCIKITGFTGVTGPRPRTVAAWVKTKSTTGEIVSWGLMDAGKMFNVCFIRGKIGVSPKGGYLYMKTGVSDEAWHHVAVVVKEASPPNLHDDVKLYRDGELAEIDDIGLLDLWPIDTGEKQDVTIGRKFKGAIDDLRIYDRALSDDEIGALYKSAPGAKANGSKP